MDIQTPALPTPEQNTVDDTPANTNQASRADNENANLAGAALLPPSIQVPVGPFSFSLSRLQAMAAERQAAAATSETPGGATGTQEPNRKRAPRDYSTTARKALLKSGKAVSSAYRGVNLHPNSSRWETHIWTGRQVYLGTFDNELQAAAAYDIVALKVKGKTHKLNFAVHNYAEEYPIIEQMPEEQLMELVRASRVQLWIKLQQARQQAGADASGSAGPWDPNNPPGAISLNPLSISDKRPVLKPRLVRPRKRNPLTTDPPSTDPSSNPAPTDPINSTKPNPPPKRRRKKNLPSTPTNQSATPPADRSPIPPRATSSTPPTPSSSDPSSAPHPNPLVSAARSAQLRLQNSPPHGAGPHKRAPSPHPLTCPSTSQPHPLPANSYYPPRPVVPAPSTTRSHASKQTNMTYYYIPPPSSYPTTQAPPHPNPSSHSATAKLPLPAQLPSSYPITQAPSQSYLNSHLTAAKPPLPQQLPGSCPIPPPPSNSPPIPTMLSTTAIPPLPSRLPASYLNFSPAAIPPDHSHPSPLPRHPHPATTNAPTRPAPSSNPITSHHPSPSPTLPNPPHPTQHPRTSPAHPSPPSTLPALTPQVQDLLDKLRSAKEHLHNSAKRLRSLLTSNTQTNTNATNHPSPSVPPSAPSASLSPQHPAEPPPPEPQHTSSTTPAAGSPKPHQPPPSHPADGAPSTDSTAAPGGLPPDSSPHHLDSEARTACSRLS